jgi:CBS domain-containing protein
VVRDCRVLGEGLRGISIEKSELYIHYQKVFILAIFRIKRENETHFFIHMHNIITIFNGTSLKDIMELSNYGKAAKLP